MDIDKLTNELILDEGIRLKPYKDTSTPPRSTIGVGRNLDDAGISEIEAKFMLGNDIDNVIIQLNNNLPWYVKLNDVRQRVLANMCFNLGIHSLLGFTHMLKAMQDENFEEAARQMESSLWAKQVGARALRLIFMMRSGEDIA